MVLKVNEWLLLAACVVLDQVTKAIILATKPHTLFLRYVENTGAGFGILQNMNWLLLAISLAVFVLVAWKFLPKAKGYERYAYLGLMGGILGNSIDRVAHGFVVDFISVGTFPVFNIADSLITVSVAYLVIASLLESRKH